ncbi:MAG TPA: DUF4214 domain-containing protein [Pyrinomonadaceae bacterium]
MKKCALLMGLCVAFASGAKAAPRTPFKASLTSVKYSATLSSPTRSPQSGFDISVGEGSGRVTLQVLRNSNTNSTETLDYATSDNSGLNACSSVTGLASSRCDYAITVGTLRYAPGETTKTINIPLVDDAYSEGDETFTLTFSNPNGFNIGPIFSFNITIRDNDTANGANPLGQDTFFIRQHYIDFLGREPDSAGFQGWLNILRNCGTTVQPPCDRIEVSSAFFRSEEFQSRGYFIYRFYSTLGRVPHYSEFMPDFAKLSGFLSPAELEANKVAFVNEFMSRQEFLVKYGSLTNPTSYVDALLRTLGLPNHPTRGAWIAGLTNGTMTRAQVLRGVTESAEVYQKYYNEAFVVMQYFGYLRRDPDILYLEWINTMNGNGGDYRVMINGFLNSSEYRQRFGN